MLQFPAPLPKGEILPLTSFEQLLACLLITTIAVFLLSMLLPRKLLVALFEIAFPFMPDDLNRRND
jgi:hypothetical protein